MPKYVSRRYLATIGDAGTALQYHVIEIFRSYHFYWRYEGSSVCTKIDLPHHMGFLYAEKQLEKEHLFSEVRELDEVTPDNKE